MDMFENLAARVLETEDHGHLLSVDDERSLVFSGHLGVEVGGLVGQHMLLFEYFVSFSGELLLATPVPPECVDDGPLAVSRDDYRSPGGDFLEL